MAFLTRFWYLVHRIDLGSSFIFLLTCSKFQIHSYCYAIEIPSNSKPNNLFSMQILETPISRSDPSRCQTYRSVPFHLVDIATVWTGNSSGGVSPITVLAGNPKVRIRNQVDSRDSRDYDHFVRPHAAVGDSIRIGDGHVNQSERDREGCIVGRHCLRVQMGLKSGDEHDGRNRRTTIRGASEIENYAGVPYISACPAVSGSSFQGRVA